MVIGAIEKSPPVPALMVAESVIASEIIVISPSLDELSVSIVILFGSTEALVIETVLPEASLVICCLQERRLLNQ